MKHRAPIDLQSVLHKLKAYIEDYYRLHMELGSIVSKNLLSGPLHELFRPRPRLWLPDVNTKAV
jgi:hypothetical protein